MVLFVDLKAAFDSMDRGIMYKTMKEKGIREKIIERIREVQRERDKK